MPEREIICIGCPMGCTLHVAVNDKQVTSIRGNICKRGEAYARDEVLHPKRMVTSLIPVPGSAEPLSVRTAKPIGKELIFSCLREIRKVNVSLPVRIGDVILANVLNSGADIIATRNLKLPQDHCPEGLQRA